MACAIAFIGGAPFAWKIGRLECTSLSSCESEWFAQTIAAKLNQGLICVFQFLHIDVKLPIIFFCDNKSAVQLAEADRSTKRMRHVLTRLAYLEEQIDAKHLIMLYSQPLCIDSCPQHSGPRLRIYRLRGSIRLCG